MNRRFTVVRDAPKKCWRIFDTASNKFTPYKHERQVHADAEAAELNEMDANGGVTITTEEADEAYGWPAAGEGHLAGVEKSAHQKKMAGWQTLVLKELEGKVCCSKCGKGYYGHNGSLAVGPAAAPVHGLKVTRYIGADDPRSHLMVDLKCVECGHSGMYQFENNPIFLDIPF